MISPYDQETLQLMADAVTETKDAHTHAVQTRDDGIRSAVTAGAKPTELGRLLGLTRARINQIINR